MIQEPHPKPVNHSQILCYTRRIMTEQDPVRGTRPVRPITTRNATFQHVEVVKRNRAKRTSSGHMVIEGVVPINLCVRNRVEVIQVFGKDFRQLSSWGHDVVDAFPDAELYRLSPELMDEISDKDEGSELIVLARQPVRSLEQITASRIVVLDRPGSPGNLGSTLRSCAGFGVDAVIISGHGADPFDPKSISASRGAVFSTPIVRAGSNDELLGFLSRIRSESIAVYGSSARGDTDLADITAPDGYVLIVGNETTGMARFLADSCDRTIRIPIQGDITSLNVSCAASILLYQLSQGMHQLSRGMLPTERAQ